MKGICGAIVTAIALGACTGSAYAWGNGNGSESGNSPANASQSASATTSRGNSETAAGQVKKTEQASASASLLASANGHSKSSTSHGNSTNTPTSAGLKPTNATSRNFFASASSNSTKRYGNGQTAGEIAMQNGASSGTMLYSPGNSQPHKVATCDHPLHGNGGGIDVHALKGNAATANCTTRSASTGSNTSVFGSIASSISGTTQPAAVVGPTAKANGGVLGTKATASGKPFGGVLGALTTVGQGTLPFTGFPLWSAVLMALALIVSGLTLARRWRATA